MPTATFTMLPTGVNHAYHTSNGRWYKDEKVKVWEDENMFAAKKLRVQKRDTYVVVLNFYYGNKRKNDIDSRIKPVLDLLQRAGVYEDDSLVTSLVVNKTYDKKNPRIEVQVI